MRSSAPTDMVQKLQELVKVIGTHLVLLFQGCENDLDRLVQEASLKLKDSVMCLCKLTGELALVTSTPVLCLEEMAEGIEVNTVS